MSECTCRCVHKLSKRTGLMIDSLNFGFQDSSSSESSLNRVCSALVSAEHLGHSGTRYNWVLLKIHERTDKSISNISYLGIYVCFYIRAFAFVPACNTCCCRKRSVAVNNSANLRLTFQRINVLSVISQKNTPIFQQFYKLMAWARLKVAGINLSSERIENLRIFPKILNVEHLLRIV